MRVVKIPIEKIYVPAGKKKTLDEEKIMPLAERKRPPNADLCA